MIQIALNKYPRTCPSGLWWVLEQALKHPGEEKVRHSLPIDHRQPKHRKWVCLVFYLFSTKDWKPRLMAQDKPSTVLCLTLPVAAATTAAESPWCHLCHLLGRRLCWKPESRSLFFIISSSSSIAGHAGQLEFPQPSEKSSSAWKRIL